jgi:oligosaccharide repeat unit polymerase
MKNLTSTLLIIFACPALLTIIYDLIFYLPSSIFGQYYDLNGIFIFFILTQMIMLLFVIFFTFKNVDDYCIESKVPESGFKLQLCSLIIICFLMLYLFYSVFGDFNFIQLVTQNARFYAKSKVGTAWVFFVIQFFIYLLIYDIYKRRPTRIRLFITILAILVTGLSGGRSTVILWVFMIVWLCVVIHNIKIAKRYILTLCVLFVVIFSGNAVLRSGNSENAKDYFSSTAFILDFDSSYVLQDSINYVYKNNDYYGVAFKDLLYAFLPRKIYPDKPTSTAETRLVYSDFLSDGRTTNITFGLYGNLVINLGVFGLLLAPIITVLFTIKYFSIVSKARDNKRGILQFFWIYLFLMYTIVLRGGIINMRIILMFIVLSMSVFCYEIFSKKIRLNK